MRDIYNLFQYYNSGLVHLEEEKILQRANEKLSKNLFTHQEFYIAVEKPASEKKIAEGTELPVHLDEAEFNSRIYICLSKISVHIAKKRFDDDNIIFVPASRDEILRIADFAKTMPYFNFYFLIHDKEMVFSAAKVYESMTREKRFLFFDLAKVNHYVPFLCRVNVFLIIAAIILWIYPKINPLFLHEVGLKENPISHNDICLGGKTITRYRGDAKNLFLKQPSEKNYYGDYCLGLHAFHNNPVIETITLDFEYNSKHDLAYFQSIHRYAFYNCPNLRRIDLPYGLRKIFAVAFCELPSLVSLYIPPTVKDLSDGVIYGSCPNLKTVYITESLYRKYEEDFTKRNERDHISVEYIFIDEPEEKKKEKK